VEVTISKGGKVVAYFLPGEPVGVLPEDQPHLKVSFDIASGTSHRNPIKPSNLCVRNRYFRTIFKHLIRPECFFCHFDRLLKKTSRAPHVLQRPCKQHRTQNARALESRKVQPKRKRVPPRKRCVKRTRFFRLDSLE